MRLLALLLAILIPSIATATTIHVPGDQPTIQAGIDAAAAGDTVVVACGTYYEHKLAVTVGLTIRSESGDPNCVTIDATSSDRHFDASALTGYTALVLEGLRLVGGRAQDEDPFPSGGCLLVTHYGIAVRLEKCDLRGNHAPESGGALRVDETSLHIADCSFSENTAIVGAAVYTLRAPTHLIGSDFVRNQAQSNAGAVRFDESGVTVTDCRFEDNRGSPTGIGGAIWGSVSTLVFEDCVFLNNETRTGGALYINFHHARFVRCLFAGNRSTSVGAVAFSQVGSFTFESCTLVGNADPYGVLFVAEGLLTLDRTILAHNEAPAVRCDFATDSYDISCTDIVGNAGGDWVECIADQTSLAGNFSADPLFCDPDGGDFTLSSQSPCLPGNHPDGADCGLIGALGQGCGPIPVEQETWAGIKARYRNER